MANRKNIAKQKTLEVDCITALTAHQENAEREGTGEEHAYGSVERDATSPVHEADSERGYNRDRAGAGIIIETAQVCEHDACKRCVRDAVADKRETP
jgi:hypothetical protein